MVFPVSFYSLMATESVKECSGCILILLTKTINDLLFGKRKVVYSHKF